MNRKQIEIENKKRVEILKQLNKPNILTNKEILALIEDCIFINFIPKELIDYTLKYLEYSYLLKDIPKNATTEEHMLRKLYLYSVNIRKYVKFKFFFMGGGTCDTRTFYAIQNNVNSFRDAYKDVWEQVNNYIINEYDGGIRAAFCISINDEDCGTLKNLETMFKPKIEGEINSVRAQDLIANYN